MKPPAWRRPPGPRWRRPGPPRRARRLLGALLALAAAGCAAHGDSSSGWRDTSIGYGQGQLHLAVRVRWAVESDPAGAAIRTPDGGEALLRVFACPAPRHAVRAQIAARLRGQMLHERLAERGGVLSWAWRPRAPAAGDPVQFAVAFHGPLLIAVSSSTLPAAELIELARRVRLELPIPLIRGCFPVCGAEQPCQPEPGENPL